jgi:hypothetical protein
MALVAWFIACGDTATDDDCEDDACTSPPAAFCDGDLLVTFAAPGLCVDDACSYPATTTTCDGTCNDGACMDRADPDAGTADDAQSDAGRVDDTSGQPDAP